MFEFCDMAVVVSVDLIGGTSASSSNLIVGTFEWTLGSKASNLFWVKLGDDVGGHSFDAAGGHQ